MPSPGNRVYFTVWRVPRSTYQSLSSVRWPSLSVHIGHGTVCKLMKPSSVLGRFQPVLVDIDC